MALRRSRMTRRLIAFASDAPSVTTKASVAAQVSELFPVFLAHRESMTIIDKWKRADLDENMMPFTHRNADDEYEHIRKTAPTPYGRLIVDTMTQNTIIDDVRLRAGGSAPAYDLWNRNGLDSRQVSLHDAVYTFGMAYNVVLPAVGRLDGARTAQIRSKSPRDGLAFFRDDFDQFPEFYLEAHEQANNDGTSSWRIDFYDEDRLHRLSCDGDGSNMTYIEYETHPMQLCPVIRVVNQLDLEGRVIGEVAPFITLLRRIDQDEMDRLVIQRKSAWIVRTIAGMAQPKTDAEKRAARIALGIGDLLVSEDTETKFGHIPASSLEGVLRARESSLRDLAATSQTPAHQLLGLTDNVGADGLAAAEGNQRRKLDLRHLVIGEGWQDSLRLAGWAAGIEEVASDYTSRVHFRSTKTESFQSLMQGLAQAATGLGIPGEVLWDRIDDWTQLDTARTKKIIAELQAQAMMNAQLGLNPDGTPVANPAQSG